MRSSLRSEVVTAGVRSSLRSEVLTAGLRSSLTGVKPPLTHSLTGEVGVGGIQSIRKYISNLDILCKVAFLVARFSFYFTDVNRKHLFKVKHIFHGICNFLRETREISFS